MKKVVNNFLLILGLGIISMGLSSLGLLCLGAFIGPILNPHPHKHYECMCDMPPALTDTQGIVLGILYCIALMFGLFLLIRRLKLPVIWQWITWGVLVFINGYICFGVIEILTTQVSG